ncbi:MAG TPA: hypothetical protein VH082_01755 [Rudaea sp.]|jgi:hypothetical protein|nr:hypothetical protein [Rudaea sp.]
MRSLIFAGVIACGGARAAEVYKCTNATGIPAFQDHPCATGDQEAKVHVTGTSAAPQPVDNSVPPPRGPAVPPPRVQPRNPTPPMWVCVRPEDGTQYMSRDGVTQPRMVPAGVLGIPGKSLSEAYAPGGIGVSAPGLRTIPIDRSARSAIAGDYVAVQDQCSQASRAQVCGYLEKQYDDVHQKLKRAFKDEQAVLQPQEDQLLNDLSGC